MQKVAIIIPCYNESKRLDLNEIKNLITNSSITIFFVNDGSKDKTLEVINKVVAIYRGRCFLIDFKENTGKANTIFKATNEIYKKYHFDFIGYFDADFSTPSNELIRMIDVLQVNQFQLIFGSRVLLLNADINRKWYRHIIGRIVVTLINLKFRLGIYDTQCGAKIISKELIPIVFFEPFYTSWLFDVEIFIRLQKHNLLHQAFELPLKKWIDVNGSKLKWQDFFLIVREFIALYKKY